tara:strand:+ start:923 stop:1531 length:609 start_codon:yes stop_codon:yes gene_type:complete
MHTGILLKNENGEKFILEKQFELYYSFTLNSFSLIQNVYPKYAEVRNKTGELSKEDRMQLHSFTFYSSSLVLYAALTLEAYINYYGARYLKLNKKLKNLKVREKWKTYIQKNLNVDLDDEIHEKINMIIHLRNQLAHSRAESITLGTEDEKWKDNIQAKLEILDKGQFVFDLNSIFKKIFEIDESERKDSENNPWLIEIAKL